MSHIPSRRVFVNVHGGASPLVKLVSGIRLERISTIGETPSMVNQPSFPFTDASINSFLLNRPRKSITLHNIKTVDSRYVGCMRNRNPPYGASMMKRVGKTIIGKARQAKIAKLYFGS